MNNTQRRHLLTAGLDVIARCAEAASETELAGLAESLVAVADDIDPSAAPRAAEIPNMTRTGDAAFPPAYAEGCAQRVFGPCAITVGMSGTGHPWAVATYGGSRSFNYPKGADALTSAVIDVHAELSGEVQRLASYAAASGWQQSADASAAANEDRDRRAALRPDPEIEERRAQEEEEHAELLARQAEHNEALLERVAASAFAQLASAFEKTCERFGMPTNEESPTEWLALQLEQLAGFRKDAALAARESDQAS